MADDIKPDFVLSSAPEYECDIDLPPEGLEMHVKLLLLDLVDNANGPKAVTRQSRLLQKWSDKYPDELGVTGSIRRKRAKWQIDRWKKATSFANVKKRLLKQAATHTSLPCSRQDNSKSEKKTKKATTAAAPVTCTTKTCAAPSPAITPPPPLKKTTTTKSTIMPEFGGPLRLFTTASETTKGENPLACLHGKRSSYSANKMSNIISAFGKLHG